MLEVVSYSHRGRWGSRVSGVSLSHRMSWFLWYLLAGWEFPGAMVVRGMCKLEVGMLRRRLDVFEGAIADLELF